MNENELIGVTLGNSTIERLIGRGGMALVFLAQQARPLRTVAVKVLLLAAHNASEEQQRVFLERFRREANTAAKLEHKNILPVYEYAEAQINGEHLAYLVMPYIRGGTLRQHIDDMVHEGRAFDLGTVASYIGQVGDALSYAHSLGIVHRDVKPSNLLFHTDGRLLLTDFGIARPNDMPALTMAGSFIGTAEYASPEQVSGNLNSLDARSDIYSLGVILYELLIGEVPFKGSTPFEIMSRHLHDPVPSVRARRPDLSPAIDFVVRKALAKDPRDRYQYATELVADLQAAVQPAQQPSGLRLNGDANHSDLTVADNSWRASLPGAQTAWAGDASSSRPEQVEAIAAALVPPTAPARIDTPQLSLAPLAPQAPQRGIAPSRPAFDDLPLPAGGVSSWQPGARQVQIEDDVSRLEETNPVKTYRPARRLSFYIVGLITLVLQFPILALTLRQAAASDISTIVLGVLLGNALNLLVLGTMTLVAVTRSRDLRGVFNRSIWVTTAALILSGFFISYGEMSQNGFHAPLISYAILLASNIFMTRQLSVVDAGREQAESAPISWRAAIVGALTGLIPLIIILVSLPWGYSGSLFLGLLIPLAIAFVGAPTPGAMMAIWLSRKMSFSILTRTSAIAGLLMFLVAYVLVLLLGLLIGNHFLGDLDPQTRVLAFLVSGALLGLVGLLRGQLDAWVYHRVMLRRKA